MDHPAAQRFIRSLYQHILGRTPRPNELSHWVERTTSGIAADEIFFSFVGSKEYRNREARRIAANEVATRYPPGHFYSPVVNPAEVRKYVGPRRPFAEQSLTEIPGIPISNPVMLEFWEQAADCIRATSFSDKNTSTDRYYWPNPSFPYGDALILRATICCRRPARVVEVGCGFSSACMLDAADAAGLADFQMTCIDPNPDRLRSLLRPADAGRVQIIGKPVQEVPLSVFATLKSGDILFIDSTHVLKTGSDVCHELFSVLPSLAPGVFVHFHDCRYPFEYPERWIFEYNYSWNEIYVIRAFLMFNTAFEIVFWNTFFALANKPLVEATAPAFAWNPGGGLWLRRKPSHEPPPP
ncbi:MAG: class I SAM-dependent methyltransferase [Acetobacteraceae bacterium]